MVPHISNREQAEAVVHAAKYHPEGERSRATGGRTNRLGSGLSPNEYYEAANRETLFFTLSETPEAVENARAIAAAPGINGVVMGSSDLTQGMGMPSQARVDAAIDRIIQDTQAEGKAVGVGGAGRICSTSTQIPRSRVTA